MKWVDVPKRVIWNNAFAFELSTYIQCIDENNSKQRHRMAQSYKCEHEEHVMLMTHVTTTHTTAIITCCWGCVVFLKPLDNVSAFVSED